MAAIKLPTGLNTFQWIEVGNKTLGELVPGEKYPINNSRNAPLVTITQDMIEGAKRIQQQEQQQQWMQQQKAQSQQQQQMEAQRQQMVGAPGVDPGAGKRYQSAAATQTQASMSQDREDAFQAWFAQQQMTQDETEGRKIFDQAVLANPNMIGEFIAIAHQTPPTTPRQIDPNLVQQGINTGVQGLQSALELGTQYGLNQLRQTADPNEAARRAQIQSAAQRTGELRAEAARAGVIGQRPEEIQAARDIALAQQAASSRAREELGGAAGAGAAAVAGSQAAYRAGEQIAPQAIQAARQRRDIFEQKEVERRGLASAQEQEKYRLQQMAARERQQYQDLLQRERKKRQLQRSAAQAAGVGPGTNTQAFANKTDAAEENAKENKENVATATGETPATTLPAAETSPEGATGKKIDNTNAAVAAASPGDWLERDNGQKVIIDQGAIDHAKQQIGSGGGAATPTPGQLTPEARQQAITALADTLSKQTMSPVNLEAELKRIGFSTENIAIIQDRLNATATNHVGKGSRPKLALFNQLAQSQGLIPSDIRIKKIIVPKTKPKISNELSDEDMKVIQGLNLKRRFN